MTFVRLLDLTSIPISKLMCVCVYVLQFNIRECEIRTESPHYGRDASLLFFPPSSVTCYTWYKHSIISNYVYLVLKLKLIAYSQNIVKMIKLSL
jgi:hypothetical protein